MPPKPAKVHKIESTIDFKMPPAGAPVDACDPWKTFINEIHSTGTIKKIIEGSVLKGVNEYIFEKDFTPKIQPFVIRATLMDLSKAVCYHHYLQDPCELQGKGQIDHEWYDGDEPPAAPMDPFCKDMVKLTYENAEFD
jgi:hypothetical protein